MIVLDGFRYDNYLEIIRLEKMKDMKKRLPLEQGLKHFFFITTLDCFPVKTLERRFPLEQGLKIFYKECVHVIAI